MFPWLRGDEENVGPDEMDRHEALQVAHPCLGEMVGVFGELFAVDLDTSDPWQFKNLRA